MTTEEKNLLWATLCAMLPYGVKIFDEAFKEYEYSNVINVGNDYTILVETFDEDIQYFPKIDDIKIYLKPMSSMTEKEQNEFDHLRFRHDEEGWFDFVLSKHLDWRGLIEKGLALEAQKNMYKN